MSEASAMCAAFTVPGDSAGRYTIERVAVADAAGLAAFVAIHEEAAGWLWARGVRQWRPGEYALETLERELAAGHEVYLARRDGDPAGGFTLQWEDVIVWEEQPPIAGYLHALCVRRAYAGRELGAALLAYAGQCVARAGRPWLRLDCWVGNVTLRAWYERLGFSYQGIGEGGWAARYQKVASDDSAGG
jgi:ribosomal protein S18 acetylase RimI-like enzyme